MKDIYVVRELGGGGSEVTYVPVPCRGTVKSVEVVSDLQMDATGTLTIAGGGHTINLITVPTGNIAAGVKLAGVQDTTYGDTVMDPDSVTASYKVLTITDDANFLGGAGTVTVHIVYDDSAYVAQAASES